MRFFIRTNLRRFLVLLTLGAIAGLGTAADRGSPAEAKTMLAKAMAHYKAVGRKQALADFTARKRPFYDGDLYVVCISRQGIVSANGGFPDNVDLPADLLKGFNGEGAGTLAWKVTEATGQGIVHYRWINPATHRMESKIGFFARVGDDVCGVGVYSPE